MVTDQALVQEREALRHAIKHDVEALHYAWEDAKTDLSNKVSLAHHIRQKPWAFLAGGFAIGFLLAQRRYD